MSAFHSVAQGKKAEERGQPLDLAKLRTSATQVQARTQASVSTAFGCAPAGEAGEEAEADDELAKDEADGRGGVEGRGRERTATAQSMNTMEMDLEVRWRLDSGDRGEEGPEEWDGMGWDGMGWDGEGMGWDRMGWGRDEVRP